MSKQSHREVFEKFCQKYFDLSKKRKNTSKAVTAEKAQQIKDVLNGVNRK